MAECLQEMSTSGDLERMKSLSSAGHHGGVRVFNDTVEIARGLAWGSKEGKIALMRGIMLIASVIAMVGPLLAGYKL